MDCNCIGFSHHYIIGQYNKDRELVNVLRGSDRVDTIVIKGSLTILAGWRQGGAHRTYAPQDGV